MKFVDLIKTNSWLSVEIVFLQIFPDEKKNVLGYGKVFNELSHLKPIDTDITILVHHVKDDFDNEEHVDVSGYYNDPSKSIDDFTNSLALELTAWEKWLGMDIDKQSLIDFTELELICHCLYEMTFFGFDQKEIQEEHNWTTNIVDEVKNLSDLEKEQNLISFDELLKKIKKSDKGKPEL